LTLPLLLGTSLLPLAKEGQPCRGAPLQELLMGCLIWQIIFGVFAISVYVALLWERFLQ